MELKIGKTYTTRSGHKATITKRKEGEKLPFPFVGNILLEGGRELSGRTWTRRGKYYGQKDEENKYDIIGE